MIISFLNKILNCVKRCSSKLKKSSDINKIDDNGTLTPWEVNGNFSDEKYERLMKEFGAQKLDDNLLERFEKITGQKPHKLMRRGIFFAHRDFDKILDDFVANKPIFIYSGRGPSSSSIHLGHIIPIEFTAYLQNALNAIVVFQMADDEKFWFKNKPFDEIYQNGFINAKDIIALGFNPNKTFIFSNRDFCSDVNYQKVAFDMLKHTKINEIKAIFGIQDSECVGQLLWPIYQSAAAFSQSFKTIFGNNEQSIRCLVAYGIDQDNYFRAARDYANKSGYLKPSSIMCKFLPSIDGKTKMSSTQIENKNKTIFLTDNPKEIQNKIKKYAFSGGKDTLELHRKFGGNCEIDVCFQWLRYFLESDEELNKIRENYTSGKMTTSDLKKITTREITKYILEHQKKKSVITIDIVNKYYEKRPLL